MVLKAWPDPVQRELVLNCTGRLAAGVKAGRLVAKGQLLSESAAAGFSCLRSPITGRLVTVTPSRLVIRPDPESGGIPPTPVPLAGLMGRDLASALVHLGVPLPNPPARGEPALLTALIPEPGLETAAVLWHDQHTTLAAGAALLARLWPDTELREVLPRTAEPLGIGRAIPFGGRFPMTQKALLKKAILGIFDPAAAGVVEPRLLWAMGSVARGGMPLTHLPFAFQRSNFLAPLGLKICDALEGINLIVWPGDVVVLGGLVTGRPASNLDQGLDWSTLAVHLVRSRRLPPPPQPCRRCRRCAQACPLKLPIDYFGALPLDRWPEVTAAAAAGLSGCPACGACALACPASRPLSALTMAAARISSSGDLGLDKDCQGRGPAGRPINEPQTASRNVS